MEKEQIKSAFSKVKEDILFLGEEVLSLKKEISEIKELLKSLHSDLNAQKIIELSEKTISTLRHINPTHFDTSTDNPTVPQEIGGLKTTNLGISTGNEGVSTDRQTDTSTDKFNQNTPISGGFNQNYPVQEASNITSIESDIQEASDILDSLDRLKKEIRFKFKRVTPQEMRVFSTIYQLEEQDPENTTYESISHILHLSQSSIRDYVQRMITKGIPIKKHKIDNRKVILSISNDLKKIASLSTIIQLKAL